MTTPGPTLSGGGKAIGGGGGRSSRHHRHETKSHEPSIMSQLFSPPMTPTQTAMAEAGVAALSVFKIPAAYDSSFSNQPDLYSVLVHALPSSFNEAGFQAVVVLHPKSTIPQDFGIPSTAKGHEETAFLMTAPKTQPFVLYHQAPRALVMQISVTEYLTLLTFLGKEWPRVQSKLTHQMKTMKEGSEPISIAPHLSFYGHGSCHFRISLSHRLTFKAKAESRHLKESETNVKAWLELKDLHLNAAAVAAISPSTSPAASDAIRAHQEFVLPLEALSTLVQDQRGVKTLTDLVATYKSQTRKRNQSVA